MTPFRNEKNSNWEGAFRVPEIVAHPEDPGAAQSSRSSSATTGSDVPRGGRQPGRRREAEGRPHDQRPDVQGPHRRLQPPAVPDGEVNKSRATSSSSSTTTATCSASGSTTGRPCSWSSGATRTLQIGWSRSSRSSPEAVRPAHDPFERADVTSNAYFDSMLDDAILALTASTLATQFLEDVQGVPPRRHAASSRSSRRSPKLEAALTAGQVSARPGRRIQSLRVPRGSAPCRST